jgi:hypothetical protein
MTTYVQIRRLDDGGQDVLVGRIVWDGTTLSVDPDLPILQRVLATPIIAAVNGEHRELTAVDGLAFLEGLQHHYTSAYLHATAPWQANRDEQPVAEEEYVGGLELVGDDRAIRPDSRALQLVRWLTERAIAGVPPLVSSAEVLAQEYVNDARFRDPGERIDSLIHWETTKNFTSGFLTGLGGLLLLPIALPASFGAAWVIQARLAGAIARIGGHDLNSDGVRTLVVACLVGDALDNVSKAAGVQIGKGLAKGLLRQIPGRVLVEVNRRIGYRLLAMAGEKGAAGLVKAVPFVGGVVGGTFDAYACRAVGKAAKELFSCPEGSPCPEASARPR